MFYKGGKKRKGYEEPVVMLVNFNLFCHKQCQLLVLLSISGIWYKILSMTTSGFCAMHFFSCTKTNRGKSTVSVHVLQIHLLQIHLLQIHVLTNPCFTNPCFTNPCFTNPCFTNPVHVLLIQSSPCFTTCQPESHL